MGGEEKEGWQDGSRGQERRGPRWAEGSLKIAHLRLRDYSYWLLCKLRELEGHQGVGAWRAGPAALPWGSGSPCALSFSLHGLPYLHRVAQASPSFFPSSHFSPAAPKCVCDTHVCTHMHTHTRHSSRNSGQALGVLLDPSASLPRHPNSGSCLRPASQSWPLLVCHGCCAGPGHVPSARHHRIRLLAEPLLRVSCQASSLLHSTPNAHLIWRKGQRPYMTDRAAPLYTLASCCSSNRPGKLLPRSLCTGCSLGPEHSSLKYRCDSLSLLRCLLECLLLREAFS